MCERRVKQLYDIACSSSASFQVDTAVPRTRHTQTKPGYHPSADSIIGKTMEFLAFVTGDTVNMNSTQGAHANLSKNTLVATTRPGDLPFRMLLPERYYQNAIITMLLLECYYHNAITRMLLSQCYFQNAIITMLLPECYYHYQNAVITMLSPAAGQVLRLRRLGVMDVFP